VKADPNITPTNIRPEWYFFPSYRWLKMVPVQVGLWSSTAFVLAMLFWPWVDAGLERIAPRRKLGVVIGTAGWLFTLCLLIWEALS
jgi:quinol-cytochrome oxidoreductase complex cytochrome b subunit